MQAFGKAELHPFDRERALRKLSRYLGADPQQWDQERFGVSGEGVGGVSVFVRLMPTSLTARDLSFVSERY